MALSASLKRTWAQVAHTGAPPSKYALLGYKEDLPPLQASRSVKNNSVTPSATMTITLEELDPGNTRLFVKMSTTDGPTFEDVLMLFRPFGKIRSLSFNTKRGNGIVDFVKKKSAIRAKNLIHHLNLARGPVLIKLFWGKRIDRFFPLRSQAPTLNQRLARIRSVHLESLRQAVLLKEAELLEDTNGAEGDNDETILDLSLGTSEYGLSEEVIIGRYPLRSQDWWFKPSADSQMSLGDLLEASYRRTTNTISIHSKDCISYYLDLPTPPKSPYCPSSEDEKAVSLCRASPSPSSSSTGNSTCRSSPDRLGPFTPSGALPPFDD